MKRILVLSDSHRGMSFMRWCIDTVRPDAIIHLGDYFGDAEDIHDDYRHIPMYQVAGNCDIYHAPPHAREIAVERIFGVDFFLTHGHRQKVKSTMLLLMADAKKAGVQAALYGHTHMADCRKEGELWVMNPGAAGSWGGSAGIIEVDGGKIINCRIFRYGDQEELA